MSLPYPTKVVLPFDIATAQDMNERHANDVALADGSGLDDGAVTPAKRTGGFKSGVIPSSTLGSTGNKAITGVGFRPKAVRFSILPTANTNTMTIGLGYMDDNFQYVWSGRTNVSASPAQASRSSSTSLCIGFVDNSASWTLAAEMVSLDADGFTINVTSASSAFDVAYEAYA